MFVNNCIDLICIIHYHSISFLQYRYSHSGNFCSSWIQALHYNWQWFWKYKQKEYLAGYQRADRRVLLGINGNTCIHWKLIYILFFQERPRKVLEDYWEISKLFNLQQNLSQKLHGNLFDQLEQFVCFLYFAKVKSINTARCKKFDQKLQREHEVADLASLPPLMQVLLYHAKQANMIAYM